MIYWIGLGLVVAVLAVTYLILWSRWGLALTAIRDSESAVETVGVNSYRTRVFIYFLAAGDVRLRETPLPEPIHEGGNLRIDANFMSLGKVTGPF